MGLIFHLKNSTHREWARETDDGAHQPLASHRLVLQMMSPTFTAFETDVYVSSLELVYVHTYIQFVWKCWESVSLDTCSRISPDVYMDVKYRTWQRLVGTIMFDSLSSFIPSTSHIYTQWSYLPIHLYLPKLHTANKHT